MTRVRTGKLLQRQNWYIYRNALLIFCLVMSATRLWSVPENTRAWFTPQVVPLSYTQSVRFEATMTESPSSVAFQYNGVDRPMYDDGTHGDLVQGDGTWTILFPANEILNKLTPGWVYRPLIGYCKPVGGARYNVIAEIWTPEIGLAALRSLGPDAQATDYLVNFTASTSQLTNFNAVYWANRFYTRYADKFDFLQFLLVQGKRGNRYHVGVRNDVQGIGVGLYNNTAQYGSAGRLKGYTFFPISSFYDCGETAFTHETGHQWINFLSSTAFAAGIPHWPKGDVAINVMGFSIPGSGAGGDYSFTFTPNGLGGFVVGSGNVTNTQVFNSMELYLMGLMPPNEVGTFFVLNNQNLDLTLGQTLQPSDITSVAVDDVVAVYGPRLPASTNAQKTFRCATVVLSEQLLDVYTMSFYDWFARRGEAKQRLNYASGLVSGTCNPFYLATGGRAVMFTKIEDDRPPLAIGQPTNGGFPLTFTGKPGISYQPQVSTNLVSWMNEGLPVAAPWTQPPADSAISVTVTSAPSASRSFYRLSCIY